MPEVPMPQSNPHAWGYKGFLIHPISLGLFIIIAFMVTYQYIHSLRKKRLRGRITMWFHKC